MEEQSLEDVDLMLSVNVRGPWLTVRAALPLLREQASVNDPSRVVILGSSAGYGRRSVPASIQRPSLRCTS